MKKPRRSKMRVNLTETAIGKLSSLGEKKRFNIFDLSTRGLGICVQPTGTKTFFHLRKVQKRPQRVTLGLWPEFSLSQARDKADEINSKLAKWKADDHHGPNPVKSQKKQNPTLSEAFEDYYQNQLVHAKAGSQYE